MATAKQREAAKMNIKKAQQKWQGMSSRQHSVAQPKGRARAKPGTTGEGDYYRVVVRDKSEFTTFRNQDIGQKGGLQRLAGKRTSGSWDTQAWLIKKTFAHTEGNKLVADNSDAKELFKALGSQPVHVKGDIFKAQDRPNIPEKAKPTAAQKRAQQANIRKAQAARHK